MIDRKRKPSPALVVAVIALVLAMGGIGYAAVKIPKSSVGTKQLRNNAVTSAKLKNNAVTSAKVKNGTLTKADFKGQAVGSTGPTGPAGATGPTGSFGGKVPSGVTLTGVYGIRYTASAGSEQQLAPISFPTPFATALTPHFIPVAGPPQVSVCPGNYVVPTAAPGQLCVYEAGATNHGGVTVQSADFGVSGITYGALVNTNSVAAGIGGTNGTWAATAP